MVILYNDENALLIGLLQCTFSKFKRPLLGAGVLTAICHNMLTV